VLLSEPAGTTTTTAAFFAVITALSIMVVAPVFSAPFAAEVRRTPAFRWAGREPALRRSKPVDLRLAPDL